LFSMLLHKESGLDFLTSACGLPSRHVLSVSLSTPPMFSWKAPTLCFANLTKGLPWVR
jgi:hypothetical protein